MYLWKLFNFISSYSIDGYFYSYIHATSHSYRVGIKGKSMSFWWSIGGKTIKETSNPTLQYFFQLYDTQICNKNKEDRNYLVITMQKLIVSGAPNIFQ